MSSWKKPLKELDVLEAEILKFPAPVPAKLVLNLISAFRQALKELDQMEAK